MNAILLLMGLLVLSYLGSFLVTGRTVRGAGLPSGVEYVALGFVLGPHVLDLVGADNLAAFEPVVQVALGWLAFGVGLDFGFAGDKRVRFSSLALGTFGAIVAGGAVTAAVWFAMPRLHADLPVAQRILLAGGLGAACSETTRNAVRWVIERLDARGPLADRLNEIAHADDLVPLLAVAFLFALEPTRYALVKMPLRDWPAASVALGILLGAGTALLLRAELRLDDAWGALFGVCLIAVGTTARLGLSTLTACFFVGLSVSILSRHARELRDMVGPTERPVLLPALLLAGARVDLRAMPALPLIAAVAIGARIVMKVFLGWVLCVGSPPARKAGALVGVSLISSGALAMCIGLAFALRFPGVVGDSVLVVAVLSAMVGEFLGPVGLRRGLMAAGEIRDSGGGAAPLERRGAGRVTT